MCFDDPSQVESGWLAGWLVGWLVGWWVGCLAGRFGSDQTGSCVLTHSANPSQVEAGLVCWLVCLVGWLVGGLVALVGWLVGLGRTRLGRVF